MTSSDLIARGKDCLGRIEDADRGVGQGASSLRLIVHLLRAEITEARRRGLKWAQIAAALADEYGFVCADPKEMGRVVAGYQREPLSGMVRMAAAAARPFEGAVAAKTTNQKNRPMLMSELTASRQGVDTRGVRPRRAEVDMDDYGGKQ